MQDKDAPDIMAGLPPDRAEPLRRLDSAGISRLLDETSRIREMADAVRTKLESARIGEQIAELFQNHYDLGKPVSECEIFGGYCNRSFGVQTADAKGRKTDYLVRQYRPEITKDEIRFEHGLINHAFANGLSIVARVMETKDGRTFVTTDENRIFAVYEFLRGEDRHAWNETELGDRQFENAAMVLADFHNTTRDYNPPGLVRKEPPIFDLLPLLKQDVKDWRNQDRPGRFHRFFCAHAGRIAGEMATAFLSSHEIKDLPKVPVHYDYHPGNLKWDGDKVVGLFDFDWSKIDLRLYDVCSALVYFCASWSEADDGVLRCDKAALFLYAYQNRLKAAGGLCPLTPAEIALLPKMMAAPNFYLIHWAAKSFYHTPGLNDYEYMAYVTHNFRLMNWIKNNHPLLKKLADGLL